MKAPISTVMLHLLSALRRDGDGEICRALGGAWIIPSTQVVRWRASTVDGLVKRGILEYCDHHKSLRDSKPYRFPIRARLKATP